MTKLFHIGFLAALLISSNLQAADPLQDGIISRQSTLAEESGLNEVRWYQVELLIFKQRPISAEIDEIWPKDITLSYPDNWDTLKTPDQYQVLYQKKPLVNTPFILLDKKFFSFSPIKNKLQLNRNDILFHGAWRQSLKQNLDQNTNAEAASILIRGGDSFDDHTELEGSISLSLQRYLHIYTNLWLTHFVPAITAPDASVNADENKPLLEATIVSWPELPVFPLAKPKVNDADATAETAAAKKYQVEEIFVNKQSRRMRSYETHYIDHPKFGLFIRLVPLDSNTLQPIPPKQ